VSGTGLYWFSCPCCGDLLSFSVFRSLYVQSPVRFSVRETIYVETFFLQRDVELFKERVKGRGLCPNKLMSSVVNKPRGFRNFSEFLGCVGCGG